MKDSCKNRLRTGIFLFNVGFLLIALNGCAGLKQAQDTPIKIQDEQEILVAGEIGQGSGVYPVFWCGNNAIVVYNEKMGIELIEVPSGKRVKVSPNESDYPFNCSPDGKWVVYMDRASTRPDKQDEVKTLVYDGKPFEFDPELDVWPVWEGYVADLYRYEVDSGKRERFVVVRSDLPSWEVVSPDGKKAFLGSRHNSSIEMPEPKWEPVWFTREDWDWSQTGAAWFKDSSGVVNRGHTPTNRLFIEFFGEGGWAKRFVLGPEYNDNNIFNLNVDKESKIYFLINYAAPTEPRDKHLLSRCELKDKELSCKMVLKRNRSIYSYDILPDGDIIFTESDDNCIRRISQRHTDAECVAGGRDAAEILMIGISPDGRRLAYVTLNKLSIIELASD